MCCSIRLTLTHYRFKSEQCSSHTHTENGLLSLCHLNPHYQGPPHDSQNPGPLIPCPPSFLYMYNVPHWSSLAAWAVVLYFLQLAVRAGLGLGTEQASMRQLSDCQGYPRPLSPVLSFSGCIWGLGWWHATEKILLLIFLCRSTKRTIRFSNWNKKHQSNPSLPRGGEEATILSNDNKKARPG